MKKVLAVTAIILLVTFQLSASESSDFLFTEHTQMLKAMDANPDYGSLNLSYLSGLEQNDTWYWAGIPTLNYSHASYSEVFSMQRRFSSSFMYYPSYGDILAKLVYSTYIGVSIQPVSLGYGIVYSLPIHFLSFLIGSYEHMLDLGIKGVHAQAFINTNGMFTGKLFVPLGEAVPYIQVSGYDQAVKKGELGVRDLAIQLTDLVRLGVDGAFKYDLTNGSVEEIFCRLNVDTTLPNLGSASVHTYLSAKALGASLQVALAGLTPTSGLTLAISYNDLLLTPYERFLNRFVISVGLRT